MYRHARFRICCFQQPANCQLRYVSYGRPCDCEPNSTINLTEFMDPLPNSAVPSATSVPPRQLPERGPNRLPFLLLLLLGIIVLAFLPAMMERIEYLRTRGEVRALQEGLPQLDLKSLSKAFSLVYRKVKPSVVHIDTRREIPAPNRFGWMFDGGPAAIEEQGQASGVIVDADGYILTNFHVIDGASEVSVTLEDGRSFPAEVAGFPTPAWIWPYSKSTPPGSRPPIRAIATSWMSAKWCGPSAIHTDSIKQ